MKHKGLKEHQIGCLVILAVIIIAFVISIIF